MALQEGVELLARCCPGKGHAAGTELDTEEAGHFALSRDLDHRLAPMDLGQQFDRKLEDGLSRVGGSKYEGNAGLLS